MSDELIKDINDLKSYIDYLISNKIQSSKGKELIDSCDKLNNFQKNFIYLYCYSRPLLDRELPKRVNGTKDLTKKILLFSEACRTEQYGRYMKHLFHAFLDPEKEVMRIVEDLSEDDFCPLCGNKLKNDNTIGSKDSSSMLCDDCIKALIITRNIMEIIDPCFLDWTKKYKNDELNWNKLKN